METERIPINIEDEMKNSYLDYAMSVIIGRALPDVRDGLKPVHRRVLFAMHEMGLNWNKPFKKSARVVGDVMGKYHPHGDAAIYDTLVRMAQDFAMRSILVDGQGNFGTVDDPPAAMRYTEARMSRISQEMLADIEKETVDFMPNYDNSTQEPKVLPARLPNLLLNGSSGIAVGMATNIPPHNLSELVKGVITLIDKPEASIGELMEHIKGPDFPTGAFICGTNGIKSAYATGRGSITLRARAQIEEMKDREVIIITELPYQVSKAGLLQKIAELIKTKKIEGISDLRDESDREGLRIVVELKRNEIAKAILNKLYKHTALQNTFGVIMLAIVRGRPQVLNLKEMLQLFIQHRYEVVVRRTKYDLAQAEERLHILEGLTKALENLDAVIRLIRKSASPEDARTGLTIQFGLSQKQAQAVLDMRLQKLTGLEREKLLEEHRETLMTVESLKAILASDTLVRQHIKDEIKEVGKKYSDARRTAIIEESTEIALEEMIAEEDMVVTVTHRGYLKRSALNLYRIQRRSGVGVKGMTPKEEDFVEHMFVSSTHDYLMFFTDAGRVYWLKVHEIPQAGRQAKGTAVANLLKLSSQETITAVMPVRTFDPSKYIMMATRNGTVKKTPLDAFSNPRQGGIIAISLDEGDKLIAAKLADGNQQIFVGTRQGMAAHFNEQEVRSMGRPAQGVIGIRLKEGDEVIGMEVVNPGATILTVTDRGFGKRTLLSEYSTTHRGSHGVINVKLTEKNGQVVGIKQVGEEESVMIITAAGTLIWIKVKDISQLGRATMGVKLQSMGQDDKVVAIAGIAEGAEGAEEPEAGAEEAGTDQAEE